MWPWSRSRPGSGRRSWSRRGSWVRFRCWSRRGSFFGFLSRDGRGRRRRCGPDHQRILDRSRERGMSADGRVVRGGGRDSCRWYSRNMGRREGNQTLSWIGSMSRFGRLRRRNNNRVGRGAAGRKYGIYRSSAQVEEKDPACRCGQEKHQDPPTNAL